MKCEASDADICFYRIHPKLLNFFHHTFSIDNQAIYSHKCTSHTSTPHQPASPLHQSPYLQNPPSLPSSPSLHWSWTAPSHYFSSFCRLRLQVSLRSNLNRSHWNQHLPARCLILRASLSPCRLWNRSLSAHSCQLRLYSDGGCKKVHREFLLSLLG